MILGGRGKAEPYDALAADFKPGDRAYLIGEAAPELAAALADAGVPLVEAGDLPAALAAASMSRRTGRRRPPLAGMRELRPVRDFEARGDEFRRLVEELT